MVVNLDFYDFFVDVQGFFPENKTAQNVSSLFIII